MCVSNRRCLIFGGEESNGFIWPAQRHLPKLMVIVVAVCVSLLKRTQLPPPARLSVSHSVLSYCPQLKTVKWRKHMKKHHLDTYLTWKITSLKDLCKQAQLTEWDLPVGENVNIKNRVRRVMPVGMWKCRWLFVLQTATSVLEWSQKRLHLVCVLVFFKQRPWISITQLRYKQWKSAWRCGNRLDSFLCRRARCIFHLVSVCGECAQRNQLSGNREAARGTSPTLLMPRPGLLTKAGRECRITEEWRNKNEDGEWA